MQGNTPVIWVKKRPQRSRHGPRMARIPPIVRCNARRRLYTTFVHTGVPFDRGWRFASIGGPGRGPPAGPGGGGGGGAPAPPPPPPPPPSPPTRAQAPAPPTRGNGAPPTRAGGAGTRRHDSMVATASAAAFQWPACSHSGARMIVGVLRVECQPLCALCKVLPQPSEPSGSTLVAEGATRHRLDALRQRLPRLAQRIVAAKPVAVTGFDGSGKDEPRRPRHVERVLSCPPFPGHAHGRGGVPPQA